MALTSGTKEQLPQLVTAEQAGQMLSLSRVRVYELLAAGQLKSIKIGRSRRISTRAIEDFIRALEAD
jgi:excisionase family DNA binding protein